MKDDVEIHQDLFYLFGICIKTSPLMTVTEYHTAKRTWRERLLTRPWHPLQRTKTVAVQVPSREILRLPDGVLFMHPTLLAEVRKAASERYESSVSTRTEGPTYMKCDVPA